MDGFSTWKKHGSVFRGTTTRYMNKIKEGNCTDDTDGRKLQRLSLQLEETRNELVGLNKNILDYMIANNEEEECTIKTEKAADYEEKNLDAFDIIEKKLEKMELEGFKSSTKSGSNRDHYCGLEALDVDELTHANIVPVLFEKLPKSIRFGMIRSLDKKYDGLLADGCY
eukprot:gene9641-17405_t